MNRTTFQVSAVTAFFSTLMLSAPPHVGADNDRLYSVSSTTEILRRLGADEALPSNDMVIKMEAIAENPAVVPIEVESRIPGTERIAIIVDKNPAPLAAVFNLTPGLTTRISTRFRIQHSTKVYVLIHANGKVYLTSQEVKHVTSSACGVVEISPRIHTTNTHKPGDAHIRVRRTDDGWTVSGLFLHPMESGMRMADWNGAMKTAIDARTGKPVPPLYIREVTARINDKPVMKAQWGPSISADPIIGFNLRQARMGDIINLTAVSNNGLSQIASAALK